METVYVHIHLSTISRELEDDDFLMSSEEWVELWLMSPLLA